MRYKPSQRLLRLGLKLAGTRTGLTLDKIAREEPASGQIKAVPAMQHALALSMANSRRRG